ncbi:MAG: tRNA 2-thiouridine(34) synthase MnmA [Treponema sp.]|nr:tRNA 2-thiouridine(34) synthase MnmA [Treponema sp.]
MTVSRRFAVGLSGGVDSAVAAALLLKEGHEVVGLTMKIWSGALKVQESVRHACYGPGEEEDIAACERLCAKLGIPYRVIDLAAEYESRVVDYFRAEYLRGRTPNPCVVCNRELKFGFLLERARRAGLDFDYFATGHYARIEERGGVRHLRAALDPAKDQSYFLYRLPSKLLESVRFPLGSLTKDEVRSTARALGLELADKPESQDFVAGGDYAPLFADSAPSPGDIVDASGRVLGRHRGLPYYTIGQRRGLGISLGADPLYVLRIDAENNRIVVGPGTGLFAEALRASDFFLQNPAGLPAPFRALAKIRQNHRPVPCLAEVSGEGARIEFDLPQRAVAPGQSVVLYDEEGLVLGGGIIEKALP